VLLLLLLLLLILFRRRAREREERDDYVWCVVCLLLSRKSTRAMVCGSFNEEISNYFLTQKRCKKKGKRSEKVVLGASLSFASSLSLFLRVCFVLSRLV